MAKYIPNPINVNVQIPIEGGEQIANIANKAMRFKIISDRYTRGFESADLTGGPNSYENSGLPMFATEKAQRENNLNSNRVGRNQISGVTNSDYVSEKAGVRESSKPLEDSITLVDIDFQDKHKVNRGYSYVTFPFVPRELSYESSSRFIGIATIGRNNPYYQFTGSEDTLQFDIDWFSNTENRQDVINSCRWIEALTKSDGYDEAPHRVKLVWGKDDLLWSDYIWVVVAAPYKLDNFVKGQRNITDGTIQRLGLMPQQAIQTITLKRVTDTNLKTSEILGRLQNPNNYGK